MCVHSRWLRFFACLTKRKLTNNWTSGWPFFNFISPSFFFHFFIELEIFSPTSLCTACMQPRLHARVGLKSRYFFLILDPWNSSVWWNEKKIVKERKLYLISLANIRGKKFTEFLFIYFFKSFFSRCKYQINFFSDHDKCCFLLTFNCNSSERVTEFVICVEIMILSFIDPHTCRWINFIDRVTFST